MMVVLRFDDGRADLNVPQVSGGVKKMCGEAMSQGVRMNAPLLSQAGAFQQRLAGRP